MNFKEARIIWDNPRFVSPRLILDGVEEKDRALVGTVIDYFNDAVYHAIHHRTGVWPVGQSCDKEHTK